LIGELTGVQVSQEQVETVHEIQMQRKVVTPIGGSAS
jgi:putative transposon-encoded protein